MEQQRELRADVELERLAALGDREAFGTLYERHADAVHDFVYRMLRDDEVASDVTQEVFLRAMSSLKPTGQQAAFKTWILTIARNAAIDHLRRRPVTSLSAGEEQEEERDSSLEQRLPDRSVSPEDLAQDDELANLVWEASSLLGPKDSSILALHIRQDLDSGEIARVLKVSKGNGYTILSRIRSRFEEAFSSLLVMRAGRGTCSELDRLLEARSDLTPSEALRREVARHVTGCEICLVTRSRVLQPSALFRALPIAPMPLAIKSSVGESVLGQWSIAAPAAAGALVTSLLGTVLHWLLFPIRLVSGYLGNLTTSWPYQTAAWKGAHLVAGVAILGAAGGGVEILDDSHSNDPPAAVEIQPSATAAASPPAPPSTTAVTIADTSSWRLSSRVAYSPEKDGCEFVRDLAAPAIQVSRVGSVLSADQPDSEGTRFLLVGTVKEDIVEFTISGFGITPGAGGCSIAARDFQTTYAGVFDPATQEITGVLAGSATYAFSRDSDGLLEFETLRWEGDFVVVITAAE